MHFAASVGGRAPASSAAISSTWPKNACKNHPGLELPPPLGTAISPETGSFSSKCENSFTVAWNLSTHLPFWREIRSNQFILETVDKGCKLPFPVLPEKAILSSNKSALNHMSSVHCEIDNLLLRAEWRNTKLLQKFCVLFLFLRNS